MPASLVVGDVQQKSHHKYFVVAFDFSIILRLKFNTDYLFNDKIAAN